MAETHAQTHTTQALAQALTLGTDTRGGHGTRGGAMHCTARRRDHGDERAARGARQGLGGLLGGRAGHSGVRSDRSRQVAARSGGTTRSGRDGTPGRQAVRFGARSSAAGAVRGGGAVRRGAAVEAATRVPHPARRRGVKGGGVRGGAGRQPTSAPLTAPAAVRRNRQDLARGGLSYTSLTINSPHPHKI